MSMTTNLYEQINEALKPVYLSQDEWEELSNAVSSYEEEQEDESIDLQAVLDRLEDIVLTEQEDY
tara:strand:+ start:162 stop:356 length:195 start_codon:yes stop_codon:yes gene_type:complete